ncbi:cutinase-domain-containing protein [Massarina eburnea CBS 473.64]|uniref:Cutinase n=1 Tax=Massarina eburnea CBS 473.64 TaxID=1395130 RepID=A0A6A6S9U5_9PLEO|nr:cutinase-domain-containing protein [Massarina eburnea CBS 473.64]
MRFYTPTSVALLAGLSNARPMPQFSLPSIDLGGLLSSFPQPTGGSGSGLGSGSGSWFDIGDLFPPLPKPTGGSDFSVPSLGGVLPPSLPTGGIGSGGSGFPSLALPTATSGLGFGGLGEPTDVVALASSTAKVTVTATSSSGTNATQPTAGAGAGSVGSDCTAQSTKGGSTENGITDKNCCTGLTVIFARGTSEPGNVGIIAGPKMFASLRSKVSAGVTIQGVDYPADAAGNANLGASGGPALASSIKAAQSQCPETKIVVSGYSQGAMVVHNAFSAQGVSSADVVGAVLFGDPLKTQKVGDLATDKVKEFCATTDSICGTGGNPQGGHTSYGSVGEEAATWVISAANLA